MSKSELDELGAHVRDIRELLQRDRHDFLDPFWYNALVTRVEHVQSLIAAMPAPAPATLPLPTRRPPRKAKEPVPIVLAPPKRKPVVPKKS